MFNATTTRAKVDTPGHANSTRLRLETTLGTSKSREMVRLRQDEGTTDAGIYRYLFSLQSSLGGSWVDSRPKEYSMDIANASMAGQPLGWQGKTYTIAVGIPPVSNSRQVSFKKRLAKSPSVQDMPRPENRAPNSEIPHTAKNQQWEHEYVIH